MKNTIKGTGVALVTPFDEHGKIDVESLKNLVDFVIQENVDFLVALGTTSEAATLSAQEKALVTKIIIEQNDNRVPIVLGMGGNNTKALVDEIKNYNFEGISAILSVAPYYNKPNQQGIKAHFAAIAEVSPVPIILYNVPGRTSSNIAAETALHLAKNFNNIIAIKEASANFDQIMTIIQHKPESFTVLSGDDGLTLPLLSIGVEGVISVVANVLPDKMRCMIKQAIKGDYDTAREAHYAMKDLTEYLFTEGNPAGVKSALQTQKIIKTDTVRLPLVTVSESLQNKISQELNKM